MSVEIERCGWCGEGARVAWGDGNVWGRCVDGCAMLGPELPGEVEAIEAWNTISRAIRAAREPVATQPTGHIPTSHERGACAACGAMPGDASKVCPARTSTFSNPPAPPTVDGAVGAWLDREWAVRAGGAQ